MYWISFCFMCVYTHKQCVGLLASYRDEKQPRAHSGGATVERLLAVSQSSDYHADALRTRKSTETHSYCNSWTRLDLHCDAQLMQLFHFVHFWVKWKWRQFQIFNHVSHVTSSEMWHKCRLAHRDEKDASEQCARQCWFNDLLQTWVRCLVASEQGGDVKCQLSDGTKAGVHHCSHSKVTLGWDAAGANMSDN